jgi:hypothetical protein
MPAFTENLLTSLEQLHRRGRRLSAALVCWEVAIRLFYGSHFSTTKPIITPARSAQNSERSK